MGEFTARVAIFPDQVKPRRPRCPIKSCKFNENIPLFAVLVPIYESDISTFLKSKFASHGHTDKM